MANVTGATEMEILLTATVDALREYFQHLAINVPDVVFATVKYVSQRAVFLRNHEARGILCIALPIRTPLFHDDPIEILQVMLTRLEREKIVTVIRSLQRVAFPQGYSAKRAECQVPAKRNLRYHGSRNIPRINFLLHPVHRFEITFKSTVEKILSMFNAC